MADGGGDDVDGDGALPLLHTQALSDRTTQTEREAAAMEEINRSGNALSGAHTLYYIPHCKLESIPLMHAYMQGHW